MPIKFDRLVILFNSKSSNAATAQKKIAKLKKAYPDRVVVEHIGDSARANIKILIKYLQPGDIFIPAGGDGTISHLADNLLQPEVPNNLRKTPVLPLGTGRMNDIARMLNGKHYDDPHYILQNGREIKIYPMQCTLTPLKKGSKPRILNALHSIGFGYSAEASKTYSDQDFRARQQQKTVLARELELVKVSSDILRDAHYFDIAYNGKRKQVLDISAVNGSYLGKYYRLPSRLCQRHFYFAISDNKSFVHTVRTIAELMTNRYSGGRITNRVSFTLHDKAASHIGGEVFDAPAPCKVEVTVSKQPLTMIATDPSA